MNPVPTHGWRLWIGTGSRARFSRRARGRRHAQLRNAKSAHEEPHYGPEAGGAEASATVRSPSVTSGNSSIPAALTRRRTRALTVTSPARSNRSVSWNVSSCTMSVRSPYRTRWLFPGSRVIVASAGMTIPAGTGAVSHRPCTRKVRRTLRIARPEYCGRVGGRLRHYRSESRG